jgi:hypothetical protein
LRLPFPRWDVDTVGGGTVTLNLSLSGPPDDGFVGGEEESGLVAVAGGLGGETGADGAASGSSGMDGMRFK